MPGKSRPHRKLPPFPLLTTAPGQSARSGAGGNGCHPRRPPAHVGALGVARALAYLHEQGLVHRRRQAKQCHLCFRQPKLADIGLVTDVGSSHSFVGTEGFIPPEGPGTPQGDLYALGKLLYELASGRDRMDFPQLPPRVTKCRGEALLELNEVVTRACDPSPARRIRQRRRSCRRTQPVPCGSQSAPNSNH